MRLILLSGGSGKRLWPLSSDVRSKQFLKLLKAPDGARESMIQRVYRQIRESSLGGMLNSVTVAAGEIQLEQIRMQIGSDVDIVAEPARRDTFLAIALAASYLKDVKGANEDETVVVMPVDSFVDVEYFDKLGRIDSALSGTDADMVLVGAKPTRPSEKYGYIVPDNTALRANGTPTSNHGAGSAPERSCPVSKFKEKPTESEAKKLIEEGALWNCGVFGFRLGYLLDIIARNLGVSENRYETIRGQFTDLKRRSFDYEVVEHAKNIRVIEYTGSWKDLGTWETFTEEIGDRTMGNVWLDDAAQDTHVLNELDIPVVVMKEVDHAVIVANHEGILVAPKGQTYHLKEATAHLGGRPMQEEKRWGEYIVLDYCKYGDTESLTKKLTILSGRQISYQSHASRKEIWMILSGVGTLYLNGEKRAISAGESIVIAEGEKHAIRAEETLEIIEVQLGAPLVEDDITRYEMVW